MQIPNARLGKTALASRALDAITGSPGYYAGDDIRVSNAECVRVAEMIASQYYERLSQLAPGRAAELRRLPMALYHTIEGLPDHSSCWPKPMRILPEKDVREIRSMPFFATLEGIFGDFLIANEEHLRPEEVYWRIVRPGHSGDAAPVHADKWFWDLGHGTMPPGYSRVKMWLAVVTEQGKSGLVLYPGTHRRSDWKYAGVPLDGFIKPRILSDVSNEPFHEFSSGPGSSVLFHDSLLHAGMANSGALTRFSVEFTLLARTEILGY